MDNQAKATQYKKIAEKQLARATKGKLTLDKMTDRDNAEFLISLCVQVLSGDTKASERLERFHL